MERLELIDSTDEWIDFRKLRNNLTHEYSNNAEEQIESITMALEVYKKMCNIYQKIINRVETI